MKDPTTRFFVPALCGLYFVLGAVLVPLAGIQNDEALFSNPIYQNLYEFKIRVSHHIIPLMVISYIGTLKTALYWLIFKIAVPSTYSVRLPMVLLGSITIFVFYCLVRRISGVKAAAVGALLLATDQTFLLTNTFDWGPVAIEHFLLVTGCLLVVKFVESGKQAHLAGGFLALGLGVWNKAIFLWALTGLTVAVVAIFWPEIRSRLGWKTVRIAAAFFLIGASPFLIYNIWRQNATLRQNAKLEIPNWNAKFIQVQSALEGRSLFGYLVHDDSAPKPKPPGSFAARMAFSMRARFGEHRRGLLSYVAAGCLLLVPLWWRSRAARFSLVFCAVTWLMMAITKDAGGSAHHAVLLWPFPHLFVAVTLAAMPWRAATIAVALATGGANLLVWNQYFYQYERNGAGPVYTDALNPLSEKIGTYGAPMIYITDWGIWNTLAMLHQGYLPLTGIDDLFPENPEPNDERQSIVDRVFANRDAIFLGHVAEQEVFVGVASRMIQSAESAGLRKQIIEVVCDSNGRPIFEIFRLVSL